MFAVNLNTPDSSPASVGRIGLRGGASRLVVVATHESGRSTRRFASHAEAITYAQALDAAGRDYDAGLMQINRRQFARAGLTVASVVNACGNMATGTARLAADVRAISGTAHQLDGALLLLGGRHQLMNQPLGTRPAQRMRPAVPAVGSPSVAGCGHHG